MGNAASTTTPEAGPGLTLDEKATSSDSGLDAWLKGLSNRTNASRKAIVSIICPAVYAATTMGMMFDDLPQQLLDACERKEERRKMMLQTPFLDGQTPITWAICNLPGSLLSNPTLEEIPPIVSVLLECCGKRTPELMDVVHASCCTRNTNALFQLLNPYSKSQTSSEAVYTITKKGSEFEFVIYDFPTRMLVDGRIDMRFIHESRLYSVGFAVNKAEKWVFFYQVVLDHNEGGAKYPCNIDIDLNHKSLGEDPNILGAYHLPTSKTRSVVCGKLRGSAYYDSVERESPATVLKNANPYVGAARELAGSIRLH